MNETSEQRQTQTLTAEKDALSVYFEALLREPAEMPETAQEVAVETATPVAQPVVEATTPEAPVQSEHPAWGEAHFQAMLFKVAGLTLAVPLVELSGVQEWEGEQVTPMPGHVPWYLGLTRYRERSVPVIDTAMLVLPEERLAKLTTPAAERLTRIVFIGDGRWGLGCDEVAQVINLTPEQVRWRTQRTKRRWLAGTVIEHMCALIDPPAFAEMLATGIEDLPEEAFASEATPSDEFE